MIELFVALVLLIILIWLCCMPGKIIEKILDKKDQDER